MRRAQGCWQRGQPCSARAGRLTCSDAHTGLLACRTHRPPIVPTPPAPPRRSPRTTEKPASLSVFTCRGSWTCGAQQQRRSHGVWWGPVVRQLGLRCTAAASQPWGVVGAGCAAARPAVHSSSVAAMGCGGGRLCGSWACGAQQQRRSHGVWWGPVVQGAPRRQAAGCAGPGALPPRGVRGPAGGRRGGQQWAEGGAAARPAGPARHRCVHAHLWEAGKWDLELCMRHVRGTLSGRQAAGWDRTRARGAGPEGLVGVTLRVLLHARSPCGGPRARHTPVLAGCSLRCAHADLARSHSSSA